MDKETAVQHTGLCKWSYKRYSIGAG